MITDWIFDTPWWLLALFLGAGAIIFLAGNRRQEKHVMRMGVLLFAAGVVLGVMSYFIDTDKEKAVKRTRAIAAAVDQHDWETLRTLLDPNTTLLFYGNRDAIIKGGSATAERIGLKNVRLTSVRPQQTDTLITVDVDALSDQDLFPSTPTSWRFNYVNLGPRWELTSVEPLTNRIVNRDVIERQLSRP